MFLLTGSLSADSIAALKSKGDASALQARIGDLVASHGGTILHFFFIAGDVRFVAILDMPRAELTRFHFTLSTNGIAATGSLRINRVRDNCVDVDTELARAATLGQPWPIASAAIAGKEI